MAKVTVDEFIVELGMRETVMKGLAKLEKQILPVAKRIETKLTKAFNVDAAKQTQPGINRMVKNVEAASKRIHKSLENAFGVKNLGRTSIKGFEREGTAAARRIGKELQKALNQKAPRLGGGAGGAGRPPRGGSGGGGGSGRPPRRTDAERSDLWRESHNIRQTENGMTRSMANLGLTRELTAYRGQMADLLVKHRGATTTQAYEREARQLANSYKDIIRAHRQQQQALERSKFMQKSFTDSTMNLVKGFASVYTALEIFKTSLEEGAKRTQAKTMMTAAFGADVGNITGQVLKNANKYGQDQTEAMQQAATLRSSMPMKEFDDQKIVSLLENESVFAHLTGVQQEGVGRFNYGLQQVAASPKLMAQDWNQITQAMPGIVKPLLQITGQENSRALREYLKGLGSGAKVADLLLQAMVKANTEANAYVMAQNNIISAQGRLGNATKQSMIDFFDGYEDGLRVLLDTLSSMFDHNHENARGLGAALGWVFEKLAGLVAMIGTLTMNLDGFFIGIGTWFRSLDPQTQKMIEDIGKLADKFGGVAVQILALSTALGLLKSSAGILLKIMEGFGLVKAAKVATTTEGAGAGAGFLARFGLGRLIGYGGVALQAKELSDTTAKVTPGTHNIFQAIWARRHGWSAYESQKAAAIERKKGNPLARLPIEGYDPNSNMTDDLFGDFKQNWRQFKNAPMWPGSGGNTAPNVPLQRDVNFKGSIRIDIPLPDGRTFTTHADVKDLIDDHHETVVGVSQGTGGGWQNPGDNAGFRILGLTNPGAQ